MSHKNICIECHEKEGKYTCPYCSMMYCCVLCCKKHKQKCFKQPSSFLSLKEMTDETINADLVFLSNTQQYVNSLEQKRKQTTQLMKKVRKIQKNKQKKHEETKPKSSLHDLDENKKEDDKKKKDDKKEIQE